MRKILFWIAIICSILVVVFIWTPVSLNGYKTDFYFFSGTIIMNLLFCWIYFRERQVRIQLRICFFIAIIQIVGLIVFLRIESLQVNKVYTPSNNKNNLYSSLTGWYKRTYFKPHRGELCGDGELWATKVPHFFPLIEIETKRDECHIVGTDSLYHQLFRHIPE